VIIHSFFPTDLIIPYSIDDTLSRYLGVPIFELLVGFPVYILYIRLILAIFFVGLGLFVINRSLSFFGIDYMALVYLFYPDESTLQNHEIFSVLRHPTYHGLLMIGIGGIFFRFSIYSIIYFFIFLIGMNLHIKFVEEKELIQRFGKEYNKYMEDVPAFFVKLKDIKKYFSTLFKFKKSI
jgi:protein-S-isoprenylcysteine O-methyltransferase Ste14